MSLRGFIEWLRGEPKWQIPQGDGRAFDDWRAGDLAQCIVGDTWQHIETGDDCDGPQFGDILRVDHVGMKHGWHFLGFEGLPDWWVASNFRRIIPNQREACTPDFITLLKGIRPKVDA